MSSASSLRRQPRRTALLATGILLLASALTANEPSSPARSAAIDKGIQFLATSQATDGSFSASAGPGITAIITTAVLRCGRGVDDPLVAKSLKYLEKYIQPDGGIYDPKSRLRNYETCLGVLCFKEANRDGRYDKPIAGAERFLKGLQIGDQEGRTPADVAYGGVGYGGAGRPDLSNTHYLMEAIEAAGAGADDPAVKNALIFVSRCQNLETEHNTTSFAAKNPDGGFYYNPTGEGGSPAGTTPNGGLRSYGSMSYAGLKSMIYAGVDADDPRVKAAVDWASKHYSVTENPGLGDAGLYYYYQLFSKALDAAKLGTIADSSGIEHDWRADLTAELAKRQQPNGSWTNANNRWLEGDPNLVTGYALLALSYCTPR